MRLVSYLAPGLSFRRGPRTYQVRQVIDHKTMVVEGSVGDVFTLRLAQFFEEYRAGHIFDLRSESTPYQTQETTRAVTSARWDNASVAARAKAARAFAYVTAVEQAGPVDVPPELSSATI